MPKVPSNSYLSASPTVPGRPAGPRPSDANMLMAVATMDAMGRLSPKPPAPTSPLAPPKDSA